DFLTYLHDLVHATHALRGQFRDMHESFNAGLQLHKGAEFHQLGDLALDDGSFRVVQTDRVPGAGHQLLEAEAELARLRIDLENLHLELLSRLHDLAGVVNARPAHLADVQEAVHAAQVDEGAEILDGAN